MGPALNIGVGRCLDLGGDIFKQLKYDFLLLLADTNEEILQHCNEVHYVNSWGASPPPALLIIR